VNCDPYRPKNRERDYRLNKTDCQTQSRLIDISAWVPARSWFKKDPYFPNAKADPAFS
jgi:hypothetical protein